MMAARRSDSGTVLARRAARPSQARPRRRSPGITEEKTNRSSTPALSEAFRSPLVSASSRAYNSASGVPLVIWAATTDPALVPTKRSAVDRSTPSSARPWISPTSHATPVTPPPPSTTALRSSAIRGSKHSRRWIGPTGQARRLLLVTPTIVAVSGTTTR